MTRFILDSNLYIEAARDSDKADDLDAFVQTSAPFLFLHAVVAQELLAGAISERSRQLARRWIIEPFERRNRLVVPDFGTWKRSGELVSELIAKKLLSPGRVPPSFRNDALLAASCRRTGLALVTRNLKDFELIARIEPFRYSEPWPRG